ncbi:MAG: nuclear transport factor 2 family protein [Gemmatimonadota bacterium]
MALLLLALPHPASPQAGTDSAGVMAFVETYRTTWDTHDATALAALFEDDADLVMYDLPVVTGRRAIEASWRRYFDVQEEERRLSLEVTGPRLLAPDAAILDVRTTTSGPGPDAGGEPARHARGTWVLHRGSAGWRIAAMRGQPTEDDVVELNPSLATAETMRPGIRAFVAAYEDAFNRHDPEALAGLYRSDADLIVRNGPAVRGVAAIRDWWDAYFSQPRPYRALMVIDRIRMITDDVAVVSITSTGSRTGPTDETEPVRSARGTWVLTREAGEWRVAALRVLPSEADRVTRGR